MDNYRMQTEWTNFFSVKLVEREMAEGDAEGEYEEAKANAYLSAQTKSVTEGKHSATADDATKLARARWRKAKEARKAMEVVRNNRERAANLLSRELSRRTGGSTNNQRVWRNTP